MVVVQSRSDWQEVPELARCASSEVCLTMASGVTMGAVRGFERISTTFGAA